MKRKKPMKRQKKTTSKKATQTKFQKLLQRIPGSRKTQLIVVALLFAAVGTYLLKFSGAQQLNSSSDANTVVLEYALPHRDLPVTANLQNPVLAPPFLLYGNGLLICGHPTPDPFAVNTKIDPLYNPQALTATTLNKQAMDDLISKVVGTGFLQLSEAYYSKFQIEGLETTLQLNLSSGAHHVSYYGDVAAPKAYTDTVNILQKTCAGVTEPYAPAKAVQRIRKVTNTYGEKAKVIDNPANTGIANLGEGIDKANKSGTTGDQDNDVPINALNEVNREIPAGQVKAAIKQLDGKTHGYLQIKGSLYEVRIDQTLPAISNPMQEHDHTAVQKKGLKDTVSQAVSPKASAQSVIPIRYVVLLGSDQATSTLTSTIVNRLNNLGPSITNWYCASVGRCYTYKGVSVVRGSQTQAFYNTCPQAGGCNGGNQLLAVLDNVATYDTSTISIPGYVTVVIPSWATNTMSTGACGWGQMPGNLSAVDYTTTDPNYSVAFCSKGEDTAHESGHNFSLNHTCNGTLMDGPPACVWGAQCDIGEFSNILKTCTLDPTQAAQLATETQYFNTAYGTTAPVTAMRAGTSPAIYGSIVVYQDSAGSLHYYNFGTGKGSTWSLGMADKTSPAIYGDNVVFQANNTSLYRKVISTGGVQNFGLGMMPGTSPSIYGGNIAFQANTSSLYMKIIGGGTYNYSLGMAGGTSPATYGDRIMFQANTTTLYRKNISTGGVANLGLGMAGGTSPAIYGDNVVFQANTGNLYLRVLGGGTYNLNLGMAGGTSPAIYNNRVVFQANTGHLFLKNISYGTIRDLGLGMAGGTSPAIYGDEVVFQANTGYLWHYNFSSGAAGRLL